MVKIRLIQICVIILFLASAPAGYSGSGKTDPGTGGTSGKAVAEKTKAITGRDGTYVKYETGVVYDQKTGLEWVMGPDRGTDWESAAFWIDSLDTDGTGWRMPTMEELKTLYHKDRGTRNMTPLLPTTGWFLWSGQKKSLFILILDFKTGDQNEFWCYGSCNLSNFRAVAVRSVQ